ncbi:DUF5689 domain-containing protein [Mangrovivirga sp. M17]|uniref:DUF5689 domain-containing protein n=1 Tax=Mangrovivirga halotolerans TaxID=2993936 RepID=A0ABT3RXA6_9BACT|nr:DUF5689 domain-containing protein [Mangrovivirga halotolerans]MCX2745765.1 DUF5689 domain-containing protein [Mangrovivirga halotolerans]
MKNFKLLYISVLSLVVFLNSCKEDETPSDPVINFDSDSAYLMENESDGEVVTIEFTSPATQDGIIMVDLNSMENVTEENFRTIPSTENGIIYLPFLADSKKVSFFLYYVDNNDDDNVLEQPRNISFTISSSSENVELGNITEKTFTIGDDEAPAIYSIAEIRDMYANEGGKVFSEKAFVGGVVTSLNDNLNSRNVFIQDYSGGIVLRFKDDNQLVLGDTVTVNINGVELTDFRNLVQLSNIHNDSAVSRGEGTMPEPASISIEELNSGNYQAMLVTLNDVYFPAANGQETVSGNTTFTDGVSYGDMRVESGASFSNKLIPYGIGTLTGIAGTYYNNPQLLPQKAEDIFENNITSTIIVSGITDNTVESFGVILTGNISDAKTFAISGTDLNSEVIVSASEYFEVSTDNNSFSNEISIAAADANSGEQTIYVRFTPNSGQSGELTGTITLSSIGAENTTIYVSGTEENPVTILAYNSFEEGTTGWKYFDTGDSSLDHDLVNNDGEPSIEMEGTGNEMAFDAYYYNTLNLTGLTEGEYSGVTSYTGTVGSYVDGSKGYQLSSVKGLVTLTFAEVALTGHTNYAVSLSYFIDNSLVTNEYLKISVITNDGTIVLFDSTTDAYDLDTWTEASASLDGKTSAQLVIEFQEASDSKTVYFDDIKITGSN